MGDDEMQPHRFMSLSYLRHSEVEAIAGTRAAQQPRCEGIERALDCFFALAHVRGELSPVDTLDGEFQFLASEGYMTAPYTAATVYDLLLRGHYLESAILIRHLFELLLQLNYFSINKIKIRGYVANPKTVQFKSMLIALAPGSEGFYRTTYGSLLSGFAHGGIAKSIFRIHRQGPSGGHVTMGSQYLREPWGFVSNMLVAHLLGYISAFERFFPKGDLPGSEVEAVQVKKRESERWLKSFMDELPPPPSGQPPWYEVLQRAFRWK